MKFKTKSDMDMKMTPIQAQVSMDDLYVVQQLSNKASEEALEVGNMWTEYQQSSMMTDSDKQRIIYEQDIPSEDSMSFILEEGADIVIINEDKGNFVPLFLCSCEKVIYDYTSGLNQADKSDGNAETRCSLYYFNRLKGYWEPAIEHFGINMTMNRIGKANVQNIRFPDPLNFNMSVHLGSVINDFMKLWDKSNKRAIQFQKKIQSGARESQAFSTMRSSRKSLFDA